MHYLLSVPFWIQTPTRPCTSHPLHCLEHYIYFHDLPFSLLSTLVELLMVRLVAGLEHGWVYANVHIRIQTVTSQSIMFWFTYFSVVFCIHKIYIRRRRQWCLRLTYVIWMYRTVIIQLCQVKYSFPFYGTFKWKTIKCQVSQEIMWCQFSVSHKMTWLFNV